MLFNWWDEHYMHVAIFMFFLLLNAAIACYFGVLWQEALQKGKINGDASSNVNNKAKQDTCRTFMICFIILVFADGFFILVHTS